MAKRWEYKIAREEFRGDTNVSVQRQKWEDELQEFGREGWELVACAGGKSDIGWDIHAYFKRELS